MTTTKDDRQQSLADLAYVRIKRDILDLTCPPGSQLTEASLSEALAMSRMPVRTAVQRLADEGWLTAGFRRKLRVRELTREDIVDLYGLRRLLEYPALQLIFEQGKTWEYSFHIEEKLLRIKAAKDDLYARERAETELHRVIVGVYGNKRVERLYSRLQDEMVWIGLSFVAHKARESNYISEIIEGLERLVLAVREDRPAEALEILDRDHLTGALQLALENLELTSQPFVLTTHKGETETDGPIFG